MRLRHAVGLILAGAGVLFWAMSRIWADVPAAVGLTIDQVTTGVSGNDLRALPSALALVGLAGALALIATRGVVRAAIGSLIAVAGVAAVTSLLGVAGDVGSEATLQIDDSSCTPFTGQESCTGVTRLRGVTSTHELWLWLAVCGAALVVAGGVLAAAYGRRWAALGSSYQVPAARAASAPVTDKAVWDALDEGHDPTA